MAAFSFLSITILIIHVVVRESVARSSGRVPAEKVTSILTKNVRKRAVENEVLWTLPEFDDHRADEEHRYTTRHEKPPMKRNLINKDLNNDRDLNDLDDLGDSVSWSSVRELVNDVSSENDGESKLSLLQRIMNRIRVIYRKKQRKLYGANKMRRI